jgi:hypothetical protein
MKNRILSLLGVGYINLSCTLFVPPFTCGNGIVEKGEVCFNKQPIILEVGENTRCLSLGDVDNDSDIDIAIANGDDDNVSIVVNNGNSTFTLSDDRASAGDNPQSVEIVKLDDDNFADLVISNETEGSVTIHFGVGNQTFIQNVLTLNTGGVNTRPYTVSVADLNGDGKKDIAVANALSQGTGRIGFFFQETNRTFSTLQEIEAGPTAIKPRAIFLVDLNNDNAIDIISANELSNNISILLNSSNNTADFTTLTEINTGKNPFWLGVLDFEGNGTLDIFVANKQDNTISLILNDGTEEFTSIDAIPIDTNSSPEYIGVGDINADGKKDLVLSNSGNQTISSLLNLSDNNNIDFQSTTSFLTKGIPHWSESRDLNGDTIDDLISVNGIENQVHIFLSNP